MAIRLACFDFDSTLIKQETLDEIARLLGTQKEVAKITNEAMRGELDFFTALTSRVQLLKGLDLDAVKDICTSLDLTKNAEIVIKELKRIGVKTVIFSGGFRFATNFFAKKLQMDADFANYFDVQNNRLTGKVGGEMMFGDSKGKMLSRLQRLLDIKKDETLVCGDGANDLSMFEYAKYKVAFCAKPRLKENANIVIDSPDLALLLEDINIQTAFKI